MAVHPQPVQAPERVLSTLNVDGSRRRLRPRPTPGAWWGMRRTLAYALMFVFFILPYLRMNGRPLVLLDLPHREFSLFGTTFLPTDTLLFMLLFLSAGILVFLATALYGRVWCGWGCPQTVYMEYLFRPVEYWLEGGPRGSKKLDRERGWSGRRALKLAIFGVLSLFLSHTFLAYFVGIEQLVHWVQGPPREHPVAFLVMAGTVAAIFLDFTWFREQTCLVACPYGRLQSVLFDRQTLIVSYDPARGEPRARGLAARPAGAGDCVMCQLCVVTCPTGIDIREGLQMECIHCTQCMDACDSMMARAGRPPGLIRYSSRDELDGRPRRRWRTRVILYPVALAVSLGLFVFFLETRATTEVTMLRGSGAPFQRHDEGMVVNEVRLKFSNRNRDEHRYHISLVDTPDARLIAPINPFPVPGGHTLATTVFVESPPSAFTAGERHAIFRVEDGVNFVRSFPQRLPGPLREDESHEAGHEESRR